MNKTFINKLIVKYKQKNKRQDFTIESECFIVYIVNAYQITDY